MLWKNFSLFVALLVITCSQFGFAGDISALLTEQMRSTPPMEKIPVIIYMRDQIDLNEMEVYLRSNVLPGERVPVEFRYKTIATALQQVADQTQPAILNRIQTFSTDGTIDNVQKFWIRNLICLNATPNVIEQIALWDEVETVYLDGILKRDMPLNGHEGVAKAGSEPGLRAINAHRLWELGITGAGRLVMSIDTGVNGNNQAYNTRWRGTLPGILPTWAWFDPSAHTVFPSDGDGHGTHTMGTMCGRYDAVHDTLGVAPDAFWIASNSLIGGSPHTSRSIASFQWAANPDSNLNTMEDVPDAISNSWYDPNVQSTECNGASGYYEVIDAIEALGTAVVFSAGNNGPNPSTITPPKNRLTSAVNIFAVGALDANTAGYPIASFSSRGPSVCTGVPDSMRIKPEVSAPGVQVRSASGTSGYAVYDGTSMASPHVAGAIALLRSAAPFLSGTEIKYYLYNTARDLGTPGEDNNYGRGLIDVWAAYLALPLSVGKVAGVVTGNGNPLNNVQVDFVDSVLQMAGKTNAEGKYMIAARIDTPNTSATYTIRAQKFGYLNYTDTVTLVLDDTVMKSIAMTPAPGGTLQVKVKNSSNVGVRANIQVRFNNAIVADDFSDSATGNYSTPLPVGTYHVTIDAPAPYGTLVYPGVAIFENQNTTLNAQVRYVVENSLEELNDTLALGMTRSHTMTLTNTTDDSIRFRVSDDNAKRREQKLAQARANTVIHQSILLGKDEKDPRPGYSPVEGQGGPDAFGYEWIDSDEPNGPLYDWVDISSTGTMLNASSPWVASGTLSATDEGIIQIDLPFPFPFYGNTYSSVYIGTNGTLSFQPPTGSFYSNGQIPSPASGSAMIDNFIGGFWDDLDIAGNGVMYYGVHNGSFVLQCVNLERYSSTNADYTFEFILRPNGEILMQYSQMGIGGGSTISATIGIENIGGTVGLQVVASATYLHNELAIRFFLPDAPWISAEPSFGVIPPLSSSNVQIELDAAELMLDTTYNAKLFVDAVHPDAGASMEIPVQLYVKLADSALILTNRNTVDFGIVPLFETKRESIRVKNGGLLPLNVSSVTTTNAFFAASASSFSLEPGATKMLFVDYHPFIEREDTGRVIFISNSQYTPRIDVLLHGVSVGVAHIALSPNSFSATTQATDDTISYTMTVKNPGTDTLHFVVNETPGATVTDGRGGPDAFGYVWRDNDDADGPMFNWMDIRSMGTALTLVDNGVSNALPLGFDFMYYGNSYNQLRVFANGFLSFTTTTSYSFNSAVPSTAMPNNCLYGFWDDLNPATAGGEVHYYANDGKFVVQYTNVARANDANSRVTFQIIVNPNGEIMYQYLTLAGVLNSTTVGMENLNGSAGLQTVYNNTYLHNNLAILFTKDRISWLSVNKLEGTVVPGDSTKVKVQIHPRSTQPGNYTAKLRVTGNTADTAFATVTLNVLTAVNDGNISSIPSQFSLKQNYPNPFNPATTMSYSLPVESIVRLRIFDILGKEISTLVQTTQAAGYYDVVWNAGNVASGMYFYRLDAAPKNGSTPFTQIKKMLLMK
ncbi:MAG: S8 family serine peptidase [Bacteroidota bacterium]